MYQKHIKRMVFAALLSSMLAACSSSPTSVAPPVTNPQYKSLGNTEGSACGSMLLGPTSLNFIPAGLNSRVATAYDRALANKPGATKLINVTMSEDWTWFLLGTARCVKITGEAVQ